MFEGIRNTMQRPRTSRTVSCSERGNSPPYHRRQPGEHKRAHVEAAVRVWVDDLFGPLLHFRDERLPERGVRVLGTLQQVVARPCAGQRVGLAGAKVARDLLFQAFSHESGNCNHPSAEPGGSP